MNITLQKSNQLKSIAILMMLCLHLFNQDYKGLFTPLLFIGKQPLTYYISLFCDACVPIFAFVSGYGLFYKYQQEPKKFRQGNFTRLKKLYFNYWIVLVLFAAILGWLLGKEGYPGTWLNFLYNFSGFHNTYNGAWWFFTTYVLFVLTSSFWFNLLSTLNNYFFLFVLLILYVVAFYFRVYKVNIFEQPFLNWLHTQSALYFCTLFQFMLGAFALKNQWSFKVEKILKNFKFKNTIVIVLIIGLVVVHGVIPNFIIAPFTGLAFILLFVSIDLSQKIEKFLNFFIPHATNLWLIHMFFYMIYFPVFVYSFKYPILIYSVLVIMCLVSSYLVNYINNKITQWV